MKLQSKIRSIFSNELLNLIASICDTKRIDSLQEKMKVLRDLLYTYDVKFEVLGGATNRIALFIDGYAIKFAMDNQGYRDNLIEYSICEELQPYVTKAYETNGYILIAECVRLLSESDFVARKQDMLNLLMNLADEYLLGDVGYIKKNITNWGVRDDGTLVILDYAYCHRATEKLFTCPVCGEGVLTYDHVFSKLMCTNKAVCGATFSYNQRKSEQGDQVDLDMIEEQKKNSLILSETQTFAEVEESNKGRLISRNGQKIILVNDDLTYQKAMEVNKMISKQFDSAEAMDVLARMAISTGIDGVINNSVIQDFNNLIVTDDDQIYELTDDYKSELIGRDYDNIDSEPLIKGPNSMNLTNNENGNSTETDTDIDDLVAIALQKNSNTTSIYYHDDGPDDNDDIIIGTDLNQDKFVANKVLSNLSDNTDIIAESNQRNDISGLNSDNIEHMAEEEVDNSKDGYGMMSILSNQSKEVLKSVDSTNSDSNISNDNVIPLGVTINGEII